MTLEEVVADLRQAQKARQLHNQAHPLGHIGCSPGATCDGWGISWDAVDTILTAFDARPRRPA